MRPAAAILAGALLLAAFGCNRGEPMGPAGITGEWAASAFATPQPKAASWPLGIEATALDVTDGDTITVRIGDRTESVRLIGIDTPETGRGGHTQPECGSQQATEFFDGLLQSGDAVTINTDAQRRDHYGRLLGYVYRAEDNLFVNLEIAAAGYARALPIEPNTRWADQIAHAAQQAPDRQLGLWPLYHLSP